MKRAALALSIDAPVCRYVDLDDRIDPAPEQVLSDEERTRAEHFRFASDRQRFVAAHAALRQLLAQHTGQPADSLRFAVSAFGKPSLPDHPRTRFSLSHSQALALIVIGGRGPLGADVELLRTVPDAPTLAERYFTRHENKALAALPAHERDQAFLTCWTRKEACLKAVGLGLMVPPRSFEVGLAPDLRSIELPVAGRYLWLVLGPAPTRTDSVGSIAEWRQTEARAAAPRTLKEACA
jgi:4'-phosphopantetheinyl transferase